MTIDFPVGGLEPIIPVLLLDKPNHNEDTSIAGMWPIMQRNFTSENFICIILLLPVNMKSEKVKFY